MPKLNIKYATFAQRMLAYNIDMTIFLAILWLLSFLIEDNQLLFVVILVVVIVYHAAFESLGWQATPGKKYVKLKVVNVQGEKITHLQAVIRIVMKFVSLILLFGGFFMIYLRRDRTGLHDIAAQSYVVSE